MDVLLCNGIKYIYMKKLDLCVGVCVVSVSGCGLSVCVCVSVCVVCVCRCSEQCWCPNPNSDQRSDQCTDPQISAQMLRSVCVSVWACVSVSVCEVLGVCLCVCLSVCVLCVLGDSNDVDECRCVSADVQISSAAQTHAQISAQSFHRCRDQCRCSYQCVWLCLCVWV
mgnify:CR=1 FL=1